MAKVLVKLVDCWYCGETYDTNEDKSCPNCFHTPEEEQILLKQAKGAYEEDSIEFL